MSPSEKYDQYFLSYSGVNLPLKLVSPLEASSVENRNTYFGARVDEKQRVVLLQKVVYGEVDLEHRYGYYEDGKIQWANIINGEGEVQRIEFDQAGRAHSF